MERDWGLLKKLVPGWSQFSVNQQAALLSFTYNCGPAWFGSEGFATLTTRLCHGELDQVPAALMLYVNPGGPSEAGLRRRRKAEAALWSAAPSASPDITSGSQAPLGNPLSVPWFSQLDSDTAQPLPSPSTIQRRCPDRCAAGGGADAGRGRSARR